MESWFDIHSLFTLLEWIMVFSWWMVWAFCESCMHACEGTVNAFYSNSSRSAMHAFYSLICSVLIIWFRIGPDVTPSKIIDECLGMDSCRFRICHKLTCDMWVIEELHGTFMFRNSYFISPQYIGDKVDRRILIWCTYSAIVKSVCRHNQLRICSETLCRSTPKQNSTENP